MNKLVKFSLSVILLFFFTLPIFAAGVGGVATNILNPVSYLADFVNSACFILGGAFLFASLIKYIEHRRNPMTVPISTVVFLVTTGALLIFLPFVGLYLETGLKSAIVR